MPAAANLFLTSCLLLLPCCGCNVLGFAASAAAGPQKVPAAYTLASKPTIVLAEKFDNPAEAAMDAEPIARYVTEAMTHHAAAPMIDPSAVSSVQQRTRDGDYRAMTVAAIGRAAGAEQIVYINILRSEVESAGAGGTDLIQGGGELLVKVVDAGTGQILWPTDADAGHPVAAKTRLLPRNG